MVEYGFMSLPELDLSQWLLVILSVFCVGLSKGGLPGMSMIPILVFASVFPAKISTGMLLLPLIVGDLTAITLFRQYADWRQLRRVLLPAILGILIGWYCLGRLSNHQLKIVIGYVILVLSILQLFRHRFGSWMDQTYHSRPFSWSLGSLGGWTTMVANAGGPVMSLFFLSMQLPKMVFVGTTAWFFFVVNLTKVPFSGQLGLISGTSLSLALLTIPCNVGGVMAGRWLLHHMPQRLFELLIIFFAIVGAIRLIYS